MGRTSNSFKHEIGKDAGKVVINWLFGDSWSTPYRRVDKVTEEMKRENNSRANDAHIWKLDAAVLKNVDVVAAIPVRTDETELVNTLDQLTIQMKIMKWHSSNGEGSNVAAEAKVRNKYNIALVEKYKQLLNALLRVNPNNCNISHYQAVLRNARLGKHKIGYVILYIILIIVMLSSYESNKFPIFSIFLFIMMLSPLWYNPLMLWLRRYFYNKRMNEI